MHADVVAAKRQGLRVLLTTPGSHELDAVIPGESCGNCGGTGNLYVQSLVAGPFSDMPSAGNQEHVGLHNGKWYKMTLKAYPCPVCTFSAIGA